MPEISLIDRLAPLIDERCGIVPPRPPFRFSPGFEGQMHGFTAFLGRPAALHSGPVPHGLEARVAHRLRHGRRRDHGPDPGRLRGPRALLRRHVPDRGGAARDAALARRSRARPRAAAALLCARAARAVDLPPARARSGSRRALGARLLAHPRAPDLGAAHGDVHGAAAADPRARALPALDGFAAGASFRQAILSGLCEVIERDSLALFWLHQLRMPRIAPGSARSPLVAAFLRAEAAGTETALLDPTTDVGVPVIGAVQTCAHSAPHAIAMAACRLDGEAAAARVLEEVGSLRVALSEPARRSPGRRSSPTPIRHPSAFGRLYAGPDGRPVRVRHARRRSRPPSLARSRATTARGDRRAARRARHGGGRRRRDDARGPRLRDRRRE